MKSAETPPLSQLTDNELIELWRRQWHADEDAFCAHYDLPKGSISALAVSAELDEEICSAPCPKCDTSIVLEKNAPFECYKCTAYNGWVIKYKRRQFGALVEAFLVEPKADGRTCELTAQRQRVSYRRETVRERLERFLSSVIMARGYEPLGKRPSNCYTDLRQGWAVLSTMLVGSAHINTVVFVDADQAADEIRRVAWLVPANDMQMHFHVVAVASSKTAVPPFWPHEARWCTWLGAPTNAKQAADMVIAAGAGILHQKDIWGRLRFVFVSRDLFIESLAESLRAFGPRDRTCFAVNHSSLELCLFLLADSLFHPFHNTYEFSHAARQIRALLLERYLPPHQRMLPTEELADRIDAALIGAPAVAHRRVTVRRVQRLDEHIRCRPVETFSSLGSPQSSSPQSADSSCFASPAASVPSTPRNTSAMLLASPAPEPTFSEKASQLSSSPLSITSMSSTPRDEHLITITPEAALESTLRAEAVPFSPQPVTFEPGSVLVEVKKKVAAEGEVRLGVLGQQWPWTPKLSTEYKCDKWLQLVQQQHVLDYLDADLITLPGPSYTLRWRKFAAEQPPPKLEPLKMVPSQLRAAYKTQWSGTQKSFCMRYGCNQGNFSSFLNGRRRDDPASCDAIRKWLSEETS